MVKVRMNTADVAAEVKCLRRLIGMRCSNVYDLTPKTYVFKLMNSSGMTESGESEKVLLLMESGARLHTTVYMRDKSNTPSGFTLKLRKHIRTRRLEDVRQLGYDRIVLFQFGLGENANYVILELYAQGNVILTDSSFTVLTLLRSHRDDDKGLAIMSRHRYPVESCRVFERTTTAKLQTALTSSKEDDNDEAVKANGNGTDVSNVEKEKQGSKKSGKSYATLKIILGEALGYGPALSEHMILDAGLIPNEKVSKDKVWDDATVQALVQAVAKFEDWMQDIISGEIVPEGYILMQNKVLGKDSSVSQPESLKQIYDEFCPILLNQFKSRDHTKFETFDLALDEFYSKIESQRSEQQHTAKENSALQKLNKIRNDQENRVHTLRKEADNCIKMAELIEYNLEDVDAAILAVRVSLAKGMSWDDLARMVKEEKKAGNPVAGLIDKLHLERNCMTLLLSNNLDEMDDDEKTLPADKVEVDLALSAHANARRWYELKKKQESKQEKTITAHEKAFKAAERKTRLQLNQEKTVASISHMRKVHWFEKFNWFISSENYLVISGRDAQQNEMIVKRYMSKGDLYVHAELHGASSTVIKNHKPMQPVPPLTLNQAGCFTVCHSQAWDSKIVTSAWWVYPHQVSKTAPTGEYLTVGSFMIRGKKNYLPPHPLIMGFGLLFRLDESSLGSHLNERRVRGEEETIDDNVETGPVEEQSDSESEKNVADGETAADSERNGNLSADSPIPSEDLLADTSQTSLAAINAKTTVSDDFSAKDPSTKNMLDSEKLSDFSGNGLASVSPQLEEILDRALGLGSVAKSNKSYEAENTQLDLSSENHNESSKPAVRDKPYISKAERRKLKNEPKHGEAHPSDGNGKDKSKLKDISGDLHAKDAENLKTGGGKKISRGQKGKLKKMKEKYADQDEEERSIRMSLLASSGKPIKKEETLPVIETSDKGKKSDSGPIDAPKICYKCKKVGHLSRDCKEQPNDLLHSHATSEAEENPNMNASNLSLEDRVAMEEDDINEIGEEEKEKLNDVDYLTGNPLPNDILLYAVPVCGPYNAVQSYKYRVKIIPGPVKKGKAAKTAMNLFSHMSEATNREKELMKACTDPELVASIVGNVKITAAGLTQLKQKQKKGKKSSAKQGS
ncbi:putative transcription factor interactor and regulator CCHC(Zn) family [Medicago truncatula]|uniref:Putative transcription factor interactor and regulator CCHC(Zn) family n=1 Tax=Medicago truncatula TaxID=3880 RepID=A0A396J4K9_MEDTR|nr:nuclear export mediator factor NEMF [Medicago truncatula]RHN73006.1 putative transcription factor interactor and regulator CCHC(Zn) family [Medicago truncatula]